MIVKLLTEHHLEFLSLKGGCTGSSESTLVKMSNCWKSHAAAQMYGSKVFTEWGVQTSLFGTVASLGDRTSISKVCDFQRGLGGPPVSHL